jgi:hypothetical protein
MADLFGKRWTRAELGRFTGDLSQVAGVRLVELADGVARGVRAAEVRTGSGLDFMVLLDRGMDIGPANYRGVPLAWLSPTDFGHPSRYEPDGLGWLRNFGGGLLTGCGLTYMGAPDVDEGQPLGLHGRLSSLPASHIQIGEDWDGDECAFWVAGEMREARLFGENLRLTRRITAWLGVDRVRVHDVVENLGEQRTPLMVLYHVNLGFPLLGPGARLEAAEHPVRPRDDAAAPGIEQWAVFQQPTPGYREQVFYHDLPEDAGGWAEITLANPELGIRFTVRCLKAGLPALLEWKQMGIGAYVLGLEPANCGVEGRSIERGRGSLPFIEPGERREFDVELEVA